MSMTAHSIRWVYTILLFLAQPVLALYLLRRAVRQPEYRQSWSQRFFARVPVLPASQSKRIWVHAVSVGESSAISPLIKHWAKVYPGHEWLVSTTTPTGMATARQLYGELNGVQFFYLPYDLPWLVSRCMRRVKPGALWLVETELWPNLLLTARHLNVPTALLNARVSPTTGKRLKQVGAIARPVLGSLQTLVCQTEADALVFADLGRPVDAVCGNLKFDVALRPDLASLGRSWKQALQAESVLLFASSREGEEEVLLDAMVRAQFFKRAPKAVVWIVPRHPQRFDAVFDLMVAASTRLGIARPVRRSAWAAAPCASTRSERVQENGLGQVRLVLGDSMGEMPAYYAAADLAMLGGSWLPFGGQNLIEACAYGCPVWMGPYTFNFTKAAEDALAAGAAKRFDALQTACDVFLGQTFDVEQGKRAAFGYARKHRGATQTTFEALNRSVMG